MPLANFRPLCLLALMVIVTVATALLAPLWTLVWLAVFFLILVLAPVDRHFKLVASVLCFLVLASLVITTLLNPNPYLHTYQPQAGLRGIILRYAKRYLPKFLSEDNATLVYAMLFGDKSGLPSTLRQEFSVAGLAHLLTVSGLHVGLFAQVIGWLLQECHAPRAARLYLVTPFLIFYAYLCGWQYSILRAVIMFIVYQFARNYWYRADPLSVLSLAAIIILLFFPYAITTASFWLSFSCVLGIDLFYRPFLKVCPVPLLALYVAVTLGSLPLQIYFFGSFSLYGVLANVVLVPLLLVVFYCGMLAVTTYFMGAVLLVVNPILNFVRAVCTAITKLPLAVVPVSSGYTEILLYFLGLLTISPVIFLKPQIKYPLAVALFACYFVLIMI